MGNIQDALTKSKMLLKLLKITFLELKFQGTTENIKTECDVAGGQHITDSKSEYAINGSLEDCHNFGEDTDDIDLTKDCKSKCSDSETLEKYTNYHTNVKYFKYNECPITFSEPNMLSKHQNAMYKSKGI